MFQGLDFTADPAVPNDRMYMFSSPPRYSKIAALGYGLGMGEEKFKEWFDKSSGWTDAAEVQRRFNNNKEKENSL